MTSTELSDVEKERLEEIPHPSLPEGSTASSTSIDAARRFTGHLRDRRLASYTERPVPARAG